MHRLVERYPDTFELALLAQLIGVFRSAPDDFDVAALRRFALGTDLRVVEDGNVERLRDHGEAVLFRADAIEMAAAGDRGRERAEQHELLHTISTLG